MANDNRDDSPKVLSRGRDIGAELLSIELAKIRAEIARVGLVHNEDDPLSVEAGPEPLTLNEAIVASLGGAAVAADARRIVSVVHGNERRSFKIDHSLEGSEEPAEAAETLVRLIAELEGYLNLLRLHFDTRAPDRLLRPLDKEAVASIRDLADSFAEGALHPEPRRHDNAIADEVHRVLSQFAAAVAHKPDSIDSAVSSASEHLSTLSPRLRRAVPRSLGTLRKVLEAGSTRGGRGNRSAMPLDDGIATLIQELGLKPTAKPKRVRR